MVAFFVPPRGVNVPVRRRLRAFIVAEWLRAGQHRLGAVGVGFTAEHHYCIIQEMAADV
jgi:hypothetical protein